MVKKGLFFTVLFFLGITFLGCKEEDLTVETISNPEYEATIEQFESYLQKMKFQGAVLIAKDDSVVFAKGYGPCDSKAKNSPQININSTFEAGSITKQMTAAAIMQLAEKGKLSVRDRISKYFPDYEHGDEITIEMLLTMRSGLLDMINLKDEFFPHSVLKQIEKNTNANRPLEPGLVLKYFYQAPLLSKPNSTYFYCNTNYYLLAKIIEQVSGQTYYEYMEQNIFAPAGMTNSNLNFQKTDVIGYDHKKRGTSIPAELSFGCGDLNSSVVDLYKWNKALTSGKIVKSKSYKQMINTASYGYGLNNQNGEIFHAGSTGAFNSYLAYYPKEKVTVVVLINQGVAVKNGSYISRQLYNLLENK